MDQNLQSFLCTIPPKVANYDIMRDYAKPFRLLMARSCKYFDLSPVSED